MSYDGLIDLGLIRDHPDQRRDDLEQQHEKIRRGAGSFSGTIGAPH